MPLDFCGGPYVLSASIAFSGCLISFNTVSPLYKSPRHALSSVGSSLAMETLPTGRLLLSRTQRPSNTGTLLTMQQPSRAQIL